MMTGAPMSDLDTYVFDLTRWEGCMLYPYLDTLGLVTFGIGEHLALADFCKVPWTIGDEFATPEQCGAAYAALLAVGQNEVFKFAADHYAQYTQLRLPLAVARQRCETRLEVEFIPHLQDQFECGIGNPLGFFPLNAQRVLVDLCYNLGVGAFTAEKWPHLFAAVKAGDYREAAKQCVTNGEPTTARNVWRVQMMLSCIGEPVA
jgi:GH24 family phage-related lysozyme (muramidase)